MLHHITLASGLTGTATTAVGLARDPVLFIHGMFGGAWQFAEWQRRFAALGHPSLAIDLRGHHGSRPVADIGHVSMVEYVDDAIAAAREMAANPGQPAGERAHDAVTALHAMGMPVVVGHSMGGLIAQKLAEAGVVSAAVLLCAGPPRGISVASVRLLIRQTRHAPAILFSRPLIPDRADAEALFLNHIPLAERDALLERMVPESGRAGRELSLGSVAVNARSVHCPVLSAGARDDRFLLPRIARAIARKYDCDYREYARHGHYIVGEPGWETVADDVASWIAIHSQPSS